jgi:stage II sporulation protein AA (anti-sigma F factor antagonist)
MRVQDVGRFLVRPVGQSDPRRVTSTHDEAALLVDVIDVGAIPVLRLIGELDVGGAAKVLEHGTRVLRAHDAGSALAVDLADLTFCDSCGVRVLYQLQQHATELDEVVILRSPQPIVRRVLELTGMTELFTVLPSSS